MSVSKPQNRAEFKKHILTKLGAPVLEINVADEQLDVAIDDAFQFFNERNHFNGVERVYLTTEVTAEFYEFFRGYKIDYVDQEGREGMSGYNTYKHGMVKEIQLVEPGSNYPAGWHIYEAKTRSSIRQVDLLTNGWDLNEETWHDPEELLMEDGSNIEVQTESAGTGSGLQVKVHPERSIHGGLVNLEVYRTGNGYEVGDYVTISGGNGDSVWMVTKVDHSAPMFGTHPIKEQNNFIVMPDDVVGVTKILKSRGGTGLGGIIPGGSVFPLLFGGMNGNHCDGMGFGLAHYWVMQEYLALIDFMFHPPKMYNFNQRTHHLHIDGDIERGTILAFECMVKPSPDVYPDLWNDLWLKEFATALVKAQWGRNLTKYNQVQLPGGIVINGERILSDAQKELDTIRQRFAMDWMDPPLDEVG